MKPGGGDTSAKENGTRDMSTSTKANDDDDDDDKTENDDDNTRDDDDEGDYDSADNA